MKRAVLYARVSGDDRGNDGRNLNGQLDMCRKYAEDKKWQVVEELSEDDRGACGASFELPKLKRALDMAESGAFDVLVVREIDRLSRRLAKQLVVEEEFKKCGVQIEYVLGDYPDTPEGALMKNVRAVIAEYERLKIIERMDRGRRLKIKSGSVLAYGRPPYGYKLVQDNGKHLLEIHEPEAKIIRQIFEWYADESQSLAIRGITRKLTELGVPTYFDLHPEPNRKGSGYGQWNTGTVCHILRNKTYAGVWYFGKRNASGINPTENWLSVDVPPIISQAMWEAAQTKMDENKRHLRRKTKYPFLLTKRLYCGDCGCRIYTEARKIGEKLYLYYKCHSYRNVRNCNTRKGYPAKWLDAEVWKWVRGILSDPSSLEKGMARFKTAQEKEAKPFQDRLETIGDLLTNYNDKLSRLLDLYLAGNFPEEILLDRKHRLESNIALLERERRELLSLLDSRKITDEQFISLQQFIEQIAEALDEADNNLEIRRGIIDRLSLQATMNIQDGVKIAEVKCLIGEKILSLTSNTTSHTLPGKNWPGEMG